MNALKVAAAATLALAFASRPAHSQAHPPLAAPSVPPAPGTPRSPQATPPQPAPATTPAAPPATTPVAPPATTPAAPPATTPAAPPATTPAAGPEAVETPPIGLATDEKTEPAAEDPKDPQNPEDFARSTGDPWGDGQRGLGVGPLSLRFLVQSRYVATFAEKSTNERASYVVREEYLAQQGDGWKVNRLFLRLAAEPSPYLGAKMILDLAELINDNADGVLKQAFVTLRPFPKRLEIQAGVFKIPFSIMELDAIAQYTLADLGQSDSLIKDLGFAGKDVGVMVSGSPLPKRKLLRASLGVFRGHAKDENASPLGVVGARLESHPLKGLRLGIDWVEHPFTVTYNRPFETGSKEVLPNPSDPLYPRSRTWSRGRAWSADVTFERWRAHLSVEAMIGNRVDVDERFGAETFAAVWALASYRFKVGPIGLMPAARIEFLDADREHRTGLRRAISGGLNFILTKSVRALIDVTRTDVDPQTPVLDPPLPIVDPPYYELANTRVTAQVQVAM